MPLIDRKLEIFRMAATLRHFSEAAAALGMTQPNVTQQIARLEQELGTPLFDRSRRIPQLTPSGQALLQECDTLFAAAGEIHRHIANAKSATQYYRVGGTLTAGGFILPKMIGEYMIRHPECHLELHLGDTGEIVDLLKKRALDIALIEGPCDHDFFHVDTLTQDQLLVAAAPGELPLPCSLEEYLHSGQKLILREPGSGTRIYFDRFLREHRIAAPPREQIIVANHFDAIKQMVRARFGITVISELAIADELRHGELVAAPPREGTILRNLDFIRLPGAPGRFATTFWNFCRNFQSRKIAGSVS